MSLKKKSYHYARNWQTYSYTFQHFLKLSIRLHPSSFLLITSLILRLKNSPTEGKSKGLRDVSRLSSGFVPKRLPTHPTQDPWGKQWSKSTCELLGCREAIAGLLFCLSVKVTGSIGKTLF